jgi:hypothetical protein
MISLPRGYFSPGLFLCILRVNYLSNQLSAETIQDDTEVVFLSITTSKLPGTLAIFRQLADVAGRRNGGGEWVWARCIEPAAGFHEDEV